MIVWLDGGACGNSAFVGFRRESDLEEQGMLAAAWEVLDRVGVLVTFNGMAFDVPFIESRAAAVGLGTRALAAQHGGNGSVEVCS